MEMSLVRLTDACVHVCMLTLVVLMAVIAIKCYRQMTSQYIG